MAKQVGTLLSGAVISPPFMVLRQRRGCDGSPRRGPQRRGPCLYNFETDPEQTTNLSRAQPETVRDLLTRWDGHRSAREQRLRTLELDPDFVEALQKTGYDFRVETP